MREGLDERGKFAPGNRLGKGRTPLEDAERLRFAIRDVMDDSTLATWKAALRKKLCKGDLAATAFVTERIAGKMADRLDVEGQMRIIVEYLDQTTHGANQDEPQQE